jgi:lysine/ornithine N-monooxygenase
VDAVILATGYRPALAYLDIVYQTDEIGLPLRQPMDYPVYRGYLPHTGYEAQGYLGLYIAGVFYQGRGAMHNFNVEGAIIADQIAQRLAQRVAPAAHMSAAPADS